MILQQLQKDSDRILRGKIPPPMYNPKAVRWIISIQEDGSVEEFLKNEGEGKKGVKGQKRLVPDVKRSGKVIRPYLMADTPAYTLGLTDDHRAAEKHAGFKKMVERCAEETQELSVYAVS